MRSARTFVGREAECGVIGAALDRAAAGQGGLLLLVGEPGIGKTRLADEASDEARARGFEVLWGRCWEGESAPAYLPWTQVLRALPPVAARRPRTLAPVLPELGAAGAAAGEAAEFELLEAVLGELAGAATKRPHLVVLDDLHAADSGSLRLLEFVVRSLRGQRLLVLGSYRDVEARLTPSTASLLGRIAREGRSLSVGRLTPAETTALAESRVGRALPHAVADELQRLTDGNPLFVSEVVELLAARGELERRLDGPLLIPTGVEEVIRGRLARLSGPARRALQIASVLGREAEQGLLAELIASHGIGDAEVALDEAEGLGFLAPAGARHRLSHALVRDAIYATLPPSERRTLHGAASRLYEAATSVEDAAFQAAHHALLALPEGGAPRAVALATRAAEELAGRLAFEGAAEMYERTLRALPVVPSDPTARCDLLVALSRCLISSGAVAGAKARALEAAALARAAADGRRLAAAALAFGAEIRIAVVDPALVGLLEEALAALPADDASVRPTVMARLAAARQPSTEPEKEVALARRAMAVAREGGDPEVVVRTLHAALAALADYAPPAERLPLATELGVAALARGDRALALQSRMRAFIDRIELGDVSGADTELAMIEALAGDIGHPRYCWRPLMARAMRAIMTGRFDEAEELRARAAAIAAGIDDPNFPTVYAMQAYGLGLECGVASNEMRAMGLRLNALFAGSASEIFWRPVLTSLAMVRAGACDEAREEWARVPFEHPLLRGESLAMIFAGEVAAALGDRARAAPLEGPLRSLSGHHATAGQMGMTWIGPVDRVLGLLAATRDAFDEAEAHLLRAIDQARAVGAAPFVARAERELAALADRRGRPRRPAIVEGRQPLTMTEEGDVWVLSHAGRMLRLRASRGLAMLARLCAEPGRQIHVLDLGGGGEAPAIDTGDAGPLLDAQARASYRERYQDLEQEIAVAEANNDPARAGRARAERELLAHELARGVGLGGRERRAGAASERARVNVQRRLKDALDRVAAGDPELGRHLSRSVRTGTFCVYEP